MNRKLRSIQSGLSITYSFIIIIGFLVLVIPFYLWGSDQLTKRGSEYIENQAFSVQEKLDLEIKSLNTYSMDVLYSNLIKDKFIRFISSGSAEASQSEESSKIDDNTEELREILIATIGPAWDIQQINLYDFNGKVFGAGFDNRILNVPVQNKSWFPAVMAQEGKKVITLPYRDEGFSTVTEKSLSQKYISLCRIFFDHYNQPQGIVEIRQTYDNLFKNMNQGNANPEGEHIYIYDNIGNQVYPDPEQTQQDSISYYQYIKKGAVNGASVKITNPITKDTELVQSDYSDYTGWYTVVVASEKHLLAPLYSFTYLLILFAIVLLFMALLLSFFAARNFTVPIAQLHKAIQSMDLLDADPSQPEVRGSINELVELNLAFQKMSVKTKKSLDDLLLSQKQEMQARMLALQSQMNPHFLYNTLTTISVMAEEEMNGQIVDLCGNVSDLLRYISSDKSPLVTMETELDYTKKYLACMQMRYGSKLTYSIDIDTAMSGIEIPKLIIQPLVENALKYGIMVQPPWTIAIFGAVEGNRWQLRVEDNGSGFPAEIIDALKAQMEEIRRTNLLPSLELDGMGLLNVYVRLWLTYGNNMIFSIGNSGSTGAVVLIGGTV